MWWCLALGRRLMNRGQILSVASGAIFLFGSMFGACTSAQAADEIFVVGSSTVFPFTARIIEAYSSRGDTRVIGKSTGTTGGMSAFCASVSVTSPSITGASRPIKDAERESCRENGVTDVLELLIGSDGIALISSSKLSKVNFTRKTLYQALAAEVPTNGTLRPNPYRNWRDIDLDLPAYPIVFFGPPNTSGTRELFETMGMLQGAVQAEEFRRLPPAERKIAGTTIRRDGPYREMGEDDIEIINKVREEEGTYGIVGFSYAYDYDGDVRVHQVDGVDVSFESIESGQYPLSRHLYLYVKTQHFNLLPGLSEFLEIYLSDASLAPDGVLEELGLVPLPDKDRKAMQDRLAQTVEKWSGN